MDIVSGVASVIACYQLATHVGGLCFDYVRGVGHANTEADLLFSRLQIFQTSLLGVQRLLVNEAEAADNVRYLDLSRKIMDGQFPAIEPCHRELIKIQNKLLQARSGSKFQILVHKLAWPLRKEDVSGTLKILEDSTIAVDKALTIDGSEIAIDTLSTAKQILNITISAEGQQTRRDQHRKYEEERRETREIREKILDWLTHPDPSKIHNTVSQARRSEKTCRWFLDGAGFRAFKETPRSLLWLHGDSGSGKSVMCSAIINGLRAIQFQEQRVSLAYWYFSVNDAERRNHHNLLRALITQFTPNFAASHTLVSLWEANKRGRETPQDSDLIQGLEKMFEEILVAEGPTVFFVVVDALDECREADRAQVLDMLKRVLSLDGVDIRLLVTSRSTIGVVQQGWHEAVQISNVAIPRQCADEDILTYISDRLQEDEELKKWPSNLRIDIKEALMKNAAGMFRWADCQLQAIRRCRKPSEVKKALRSLPKDLKESYTRELGNIENDVAEDVRRLLAWLIFVKRPLRVEEVADMLAVNLQADPPLFDEDSRMPRPEDILRFCGSLIRLNESHDASADTEEQVQFRTFSAAHASVVEFLQHEHVQIGSTKEFVFASAAMQLEMAETCLVYLLNIIENATPLDHTILTNYPMAHLSADAWFNFYFNAKKVAEGENTALDLDRVHRLIARLLRSPGTMLRWYLLRIRQGDTTEICRWVIRGGSLRYNCLWITGYFMQATYGQKALSSVKVCQGFDNAMQQMEEWDGEESLEYAEENVWFRSLLGDKTLESMRSLALQTWKEAGGIGKGRTELDSILWNGPILNPWIEILRNLEYSVSSLHQQRIIDF
ncbi:MAG: hypothetical protein Q9195_004034 [Heterodermia aff. obscurata]